MVHAQRIHPALLNLQLRGLSQRNRHTPSLSSMAQAISPSSSTTKMALLNPTLQPQFNTYSRHKPASLWLQLMKQINGHVLTIPANSGTNLTLPVYHVVDNPNTIPLDLATRLIQIITTKRGSNSVYSDWALQHLENALHSPTDQVTHNHFSGNNTITQNTQTPTRHQTFSLISILVSLVLSVLQRKCQHNLLFATH